MQSAKIDVTKIDKAHLYKGKKGTYLDVTFLDNKNGQDEYGNDGFVVQNVSKEERERGTKGPIIGNWRHIGTKKQTPRQQQRPQRDPDLDPDEDGKDLPF